MRGSLIALGLLLVATNQMNPTQAQVSAEQNDVYGYGIPYPFVHLRQGSATMPGTSAFLAENNPFALYWRGRDLVQRVYTEADGAMTRAGEVGGPLYVTGSAAEQTDAPPRMRRDHAASCGMCHAVPFAEPGSGPVIASTGPKGRDTPHFFGAGLVEMIGAQIRDTILATCDRSKKGWISKDDARAGCQALVKPADSSPPIDFGNIRPDARGIPTLNSSIRVWFVDTAGLPINAASLDDDRVAGFDFAVGVFGWGRGTRSWPDGRVTSEGGEAATVREFASLAADAHIGIGTDDPTQVGNRFSVDSIGGKAMISQSGALQFDLGAAQARDSASQNSDPSASSSKKRLTFTTGDLDAIEFYMLHLPPPAILASSESARGQEVFKSIGCALCHVDRWSIKNDRRRFVVEPLTARNGTERRIELSLNRSNGRRQADVRVFSDFRHWDIGPAFHELRFDNTVQTAHRTAPLWGVATTAPYGHDGRYETLEQVVLAHGGAADKAARTFEGLPGTQRNAVIAFLRSLQLYPTLQTPADIDGDGVATEDFKVGNVRVGREVFQPRFLFSGGLDVDVFCCVPLADGGMRPLFRPRLSRSPWGAPDVASGEHK
ncbi:Di-haem oxidoreductase, putative peroxidase [Tardiphaga sp. OK246]|uniref:di-heme oxidoredictase family protein n=1 Tax=Tardiphaga sp. OK246 TaxID=1855307 RepID=UPI000B6D550C|nr:di-heme oxidoredictase family protein [Tardiphaga sp. OK246]SNS46078.1 Di-haem oxidoreductase, putative peroxidase [Tardiphaga sp. OK246]